MKVVENGLTVDIFRKLRETGPFVRYDEADIKLALKHTLYSVVVYDGDQPIGTARLVGDNRLTFFFKDVVVLPEYRGKGVGKLLIQSLFEYIDKHAADNAYVGLNSTLGRETFYERFGFVRRPTEELGSGMSMYYRRSER